jgi:hypothetical protein
MRRKVRSEEVGQLRQNIGMVEFLSKVYEREHTSSYYFSVLSLMFSNLVVLAEKLDSLIEETKLEGER